MAEVLFNQLYQNPIPTILRMQDLGLKQPPEIPEAELWRCKHILAINLSGNDFEDKMEVLRWLLPFKRLEVVILGWDDITDDHISILSQLINLRLLDDLPMEDDISMSEELRKEQYAHLMDPWTLQKLPMSQQRFYNQSEDEFSKYLQYEVNDEIPLEMESLPYSIRYIVLNNINLQSVPYARRNNQIIYLDLRKNNNITTGNIIEALSSYDSLQTLFIDENILQQINIDDIKSVCKHLRQINEQYLTDDTQNKEIYDFTTVVGINYYEFLKEENILQTLDTQDNQFVVKPQISPSKSSPISQNSNIISPRQQAQLLSDFSANQVTEPQLQQKTFSFEQPRQQQEGFTEQQGEIDSDGEIVDLDNNQNQQHKSENQNNIIIDLSNLNLTNEQLIQYLLNDKRISDCVQQKQGIILNLQGNKNISLHGLQQIDKQLASQVIKLNILNTDILQNDQQVNTLLSTFPALLDLQTNYDVQDFTILEENILNNNRVIQNINNYKLVNDSQYKNIDEEGKIMFADSQILREIQPQNLCKDTENIQTNEKQPYNNTQHDQSLLSQQQSEIAQQHDVDMLLQQVQQEEENINSFSEYAGNPNKRSSLHEDQKRRPEQEQTNVGNNIIKPTYPHTDNQEHQSGVSQALNISLTGSFDNFVEATPMQQFVYKSLYMKSPDSSLQQPNVNKHEFINYFIPPLSAVKSAVNDVVEEFRRNITASVHEMRKVKIPHLNQLIGQYEDELQSSNNPLKTIPKKVFKQIAIPQTLKNIEESSVEAVAFERISPSNKLMKVMQKIYQCQTQYFDSSQRVKELYKQSLEKQANLQNNQKVLQIFAETYILQNSLQQLSTYNPVLLKHQNEQKKIFFNTMGKLKLLQQQLLVMKNQENIQLQKIEINKNRSLQTNLLVPDHLFNPTSNLLNAQQIIKLFRNAINHFQQKNQDPQATSTGDFIDFFTNQFFPLQYGTKIAKQKQNMFYKSLKENLDHFHVAAIYKCLVENKIAQYEQALIQLESIQFDLLKGAVYSVDKNVTEAIATKKVNSFITGYIEKKYWEDVLKSLDPTLIPKLAEKNKIDWDLFKGLLMLHVLEQQEKNDTKNATLHSVNWEQNDSIMDPNK